MQYIKIKNWDKYQARSDRPTGPWIKLHTEIPENYEFSVLSDNHKLQLIMLWVLAGRVGNLLPMDSKWLSRRTHIESEIDVDVLIESGFIYIASEEEILLDKELIGLARKEAKEQALSETPADEGAIPVGKVAPSVRAVPTNKKIDTIKYADEEDDSRSLPSKVSDVLAYWREHLNVSKLKTDTDKRKGKVRVRLNEGYSVSYLKAAIRGIKKSNWHVEHEQLDIFNVFKNEEQMQRFALLETSGGEKSNAEASVDAAVRAIEAGFSVSESEEDDLAVPMGQGLWDEKVVSSQ